MNHQEAYPGLEPVVGPVTLVIPNDGDEKGATTARKRKILGLSVTVFFLSLVIAFLLIGGLVGGLVGGLLAHRQKTSSPTSQTQTVSVTLIRNTYSPTSATSTSSTPPKPTANKVNGVYPGCPGSDLTIYTVPGTTQKFLRQCGTDYPSPNGYDDIEASEATSMEACIALCAKWNTDPASANRCVAVTWNYSGPQGEDSNYCWVKNATRNGKEFADQVESAILVSG